jgi:solute carrier family 6 (neurotransmitter transporter) member 19
MMMLEFALGQVMQQGNISVWNRLHPRLTGVGIASVFAAYIISFYYNVIISWAIVYFFSSFYNPLPWSTQNADADYTKTCKEYPITQEYFYKDILHTITPDCEKYDTSTTMGGATEFQW